MKYSKEEIENLSDEEIKKLKEKLDKDEGKTKLSDAAQVVVNKFNNAAIKQRIKESEAT